MDFVLGIFVQARLVEVFWAYVSYGYKRPT